MQWIDEMFANMTRDKAVASAKRSAHRSKPDGAVDAGAARPGVGDAWGALVASIARDVDAFNRHPRRAGMAAVCVSERPLQCEVYLPGMHSQTLVLTLENEDLQVLVHPEFPNQPLAIKLDLDRDGRLRSWILGEPAEENSKRSAAELAEYLLKPVLASADINAEP